MESTGEDRSKYGILVSKSRALRLAVLGGVGGWRPQKGRVQPTGSYGAPLRSELLIYRIKGAGNRIRRGS